MSRALSSKFAKRALLVVCKDMHMDICSVPHACQHRLSASVCCGRLVSHALAIQVKHSEYARHAWRAHALLAQVDC